MVRASYASSNRHFLRECRLNTESGRRHSFDPKNPNFLQAGMASQQRRNLRSPASTAPRASRHAKSIISYRESSSETDLQITEEDQDESDVPEVETPRISERHTQKPGRLVSSQQQHRSQTLRQPSQPGKLKVTGRKRHRPADIRSSHHLAATKALPSEPMNIENGGTIPAWTSLPYEILLSIFQYASYPLYDERTFQSTASVDWLIKTSRLCRAFAEPALTVLYRSPPLVPMDRAHMLRQLLVADPAPMSYNYRAKVERLQMEVSQTAAYTLSGSGLLDLYGLVFHCPRLLDLELFHQEDFSPYRRLDESIKWTYPDSLFVALNRNVTGHPTHLRSWRWSSRLAGKKRPIENLKEIHRSPAFNTLRKIAFVNYQKVWPRKNMEDPRHEKVLAESLSVLLNLEYLVFESTTLVNSIILPLLPRYLKHLEIINCSEIDSDDLASFLVSHGSQLRTLTLNHNISLSLSFLTTLGVSCQNLESLRMNLTYYSAHSSYRDSDPGYDALLGVNEKPHWPASLRTIELTQLRRWDVDTAKMFFQSLLDNASILVNLRRLVIKAILNTSWRDRSSFRDEWIGAFERVFKRPADEPNVISSSLGDRVAQKGKDDRSDSDASHSDGTLMHRPLKHRRLASVGEASQSKSRSKRAFKSVHKNYAETRVGDVQFPSGNQRRGEDKNNKGEEQLQASSVRRSMRIVRTRPGLKNQPAELKPTAEIEEHEKHHLAILSNEVTQMSFRDSKTELTMSRELEVLLETAPAAGCSGNVSIGASDKDVRAEYNSDSDNMPLATSRHAQKNKKAQHIQGMCDVVSIIIDNLRPTETQYVEADFLDSEPEGDEDWDGSEDVLGDGRYAW